VEVVHVVHFLQPVFINFLVGKRGVYGGLMVTMMLPVCSSLVVSLGKILNSHRASLYIFLCVYV